MLNQAIFLLTVAALCARADVVLDAVNQGNISPDSSESSFIFAGFVTSPERDWLEFAIPKLPSTLASATLELFQPQFGHLGGTLTYSVYALAGAPGHFSDISASTLYGSVSTDAASDGTSVSIALTTAALNAIYADQGGDFFIGGIDSRETGPSIAGDFGGQPGRNILKLAVVPEPAPWGLTVVGVFGIVFTRRSLGRTMSKQCQGQTRSLQILIPETRCQSRLACAG